jgi:tetratricopeptide (TPR) repeat protein
VANPRPSSPPATGPNCWATIAVCALLLAAVAAVFGQTVGYEFVNYDDDLYVSENPRISAGLSGAAVVRAFTESHAFNWHPLTTLSHLLDCQIYGLRPGGHHLTNVLLHAAVAILLFLVVQRMTGAIWPSAFVAAAFAVHPLRVESVAWIAERKDLLSGLFFVLTLGAYVRYAACRSSWMRYAALIAVYALGLLAKPMLVTLPLVLLLLDYWPLRANGRTTSAAGNAPQPACADASIGHLLLEKIPLFVLAAGSCLVTLLVQREALESIERFSLPIRIGNALVAYAVYLRQLFWPIDLAVLYPHPGKHLSLWAVGGAVLLLLAISAAVWIGRRRHPYLIVGWLWYLVMLVPVIGLIQVGVQSHADRYTYLPQIGLLLALTWAARDLLARRPNGRWIACAGAGLILAALLAIAIRQTMYWHDSETLWRHTLACESRIVQAHNQLGIVLDKKGQIDPAFEQFQAAIEVDPRYARAYSNLGFVWQQKGQVAEAIACYQRSLQIEPRFAQAHCNWSDTLIKMGRFDEAMDHCRQALELDPRNIAAQIAMAKLLQRAERWPEALLHAEAAEALNPRNAEVYNNQGIILRKLGRLPESIACYHKAIELKPDYDEAYNNMANALSQAGQLEEAMASYRRALQINPRLAAVHYNLGSLLLQGGHTAEAIAQFQQTLAIDPGLTAARNGLDQAQRLLKSP